jgi:hypothetical protein
MKKEMLKTREPEDEGEMNTDRWFSTLNFASPRATVPISGQRQRFEDSTIAALF